MVRMPTKTPCPAKIASPLFAVLSGKLIAKTSCPSKIASISNAALSGELIAAKSREGHYTVCQHYGPVEPLITPHGITSHHLSPHSRDCSTRR